MTADLIIPAVLLVTFVAAVLLIGFIIYWQAYFHIHRVSLRPKSGGKVVGFFHPHCSAGGGGERVLWKALQVLGELQEEDGSSKSKQKNKLKLHAVIYTIDPPTENYERDLRAHVKTRFSIEISPLLPLYFVHVDHCAHYLGEYKYLLLDCSVFTVLLCKRILKH